MAPISLTPMAFLSTARSCLNLVSSCGSAESVGAPLGFRFSELIELVDGELVRLGCEFDDELRLSEGIVQLQLLSSEGR